MHGDHHHHDQCSFTTIITTIMNSVHPKITTIPSVQCLSYWIKDVNFQQNHVREARGR
jgi:hypothetical protein